MLLLDNNPKKPSNQPLYTRQKKRERNKQKNPAERTGSKFSLPDTSRDLSYLYVIRQVEHALTPNILFFNELPFPFLQACWRAKWFARQMQTTTTGLAGMDFVPVHGQRFTAESKLLNSKVSAQNCSKSSARRLSPGDLTASCLNGCHLTWVLANASAGPFDDSVDSQIKCTPPRVYKYPSLGHINQITAIPALCPQNRRYSTDLNHHRSPGHYLALRFARTLLL